MASKYCREVEVPIALERHETKQACVVPVILRTCDWTNTPFAKLQAFPKDARPIVTWENQDEAFLSVVQGIRTAAQIIQDYRKQQLEHKQLIRSQYLQKVEEALSDGVISIVERDTLNELQKDLGLTLKEAQEIETHVYEPFSRYQENLEKYQQTLSRLIDTGYYPFNEQIDRDLKNRQRDLGLRAEDVKRVEEPILAAAQHAYEKNRGLQQTQNNSAQQTEIEPSQSEQSQQQQQQQQAFSTHSQSETQNSEEFSADQPSKRLTQTQTVRREDSTVETKTQDLNGNCSQIEYFSDHLGNDIQLDMVLIPGGDFSMGTAEKLAKEQNEQPQHTVTVQSFFMGKFSVTQAQWWAVSGLPRVNINLEPKPACFQGDNRPVEQVSWYEAVEFCDRLSHKTGRTYRLPSEAEWEYACRANTSTSFHFGETLPQNSARFNSGNILTFHTKALFDSTAEVGSCSVANNFGLYDMHGNVLEWCEDHWHDNYQNAPSNQQAWLSDDQERVRVLRGGAWDYPAKNCRSAFRARYAPDFRLNSIGFRVAMTAS
ncbi:MAG: formylglycine-generating enzyme family protein, partial [Cyanobacteriota bacterium]|nr:formylglycine-generating enzyme family protein [Cyanobacteriota bacterium]